jgi:hypothetical protein
MRDALLTGTLDKLGSTPLSLLMLVVVVNVPILL